MNKLIGLTKRVFIILAWIGVALSALLFWDSFGSYTPINSLYLIAYGIFLLYVIKTLKRTN
jgi:hypothetical protein